MRSEAAGILTDVASYSIVCYRLRHPARYQTIWASRRLGKSCWMKRPCLTPWSVISMPSVTLPLFVPLSLPPSFSFPLSPSLDRKDRSVPLHGSAWKQSCIVRWQGAARVTCAVLFALLHLFLLAYQMLASADSASRSVLWLVWRCTVLILQAETRKRRGELQSKATIGRWRATACMPGAGLVHCTSHSTSKNHA